MVINIAKSSGTVKLTGKKEAAFKADQARIMEQEKERKAKAIDNSLTKGAVGAVLAELELLHPGITENVRVRMQQT